MISRRRFVRDGAALAAGAALSGPATALAGNAGVADTVFRNGRVLTVAGRRTAEAVAVSAGRIAYVGSTSGAGAWVGPSTEVINLRGRTLMPGIHDGHTHPLAGGLVLTKPTLDYRKLDLKQFIKALRTFLGRSEDQEPDGWLSVDLWEPSGMDRQPTKRDLDRLPTRRPIIVVDLSGHTAVANSRALELAGITAATPDPQGGKIKRGRRREPTGVLIDDAIGLVLGKVPPLTTAQNADALDAGHRAMAEQGITSYLDASVGNTELAALAALADRGPLTIRPSVAITVSPNAAAEPEEMLARLERLRTTYGRAGVTIRTVKMFFDGVIEHPTQSAALLQPYRVNKGTKRNPRWRPGKSRGPTYFRQGVANRAIAALDAAGWQVHVHAIGDRAVRSALDAFENARKRGPRQRQPPHDLAPGADPPEGLPALRTAGRAPQLSDALGRARLVHGRCPQAVHRRAPLALRVPGRKPRARGRQALRGQRLAGRSAAAVPPDRDRREPHRRRGLRGVPEAAVGPGGPEPARVAGDAHPQQRISAAPGELTGQVRQGLAADLIVLDRDVLRAPLKRVSKTRST